jgi:hypothetical protein
MHDVHIIVPVSEQYRYSIGTVSALYTTLIGKPIRGDVHRVGRLDIVTHAWVESRWVCRAQASWPCAP